MFIDICYGSFFYNDRENMHQWTRIIQGAIALSLAVMALLLYVKRKEECHQGCHDPKQASRLLPVYIINLTRRPDRLRGSLAQFQGACMANVHVVEAVDGRTLDISRLHTTKTTGEVACFLSHLKALSAFAATEAPWALVLEDDGRLDLPVADIHGLAQEAQGSGADIIALGCNSFPSHPRHTHRLSHRLYRFVDYNLYGAHAMLYSQQGARDILRAAATQSFHVPYDFWLTQEFSGRLAVARPTLAHAVDVSDSDTQKTR